MRHRSRSCQRNVGDAVGQEQPFGKADLEITMRKSRQYPKKADLSS
jgi:hypothetical protein